MKVGFFDSGMGGITVLKEALKILPKLDYIYYADTANVPYGVKSKEEVKGFVLEAADFIARQGVGVLVVACNTATSIAINDLRRKYDIPILGMEPAVKPAVEHSMNKRVLVMATPLTIKEEKFNNLVAKVDSQNIVDTLPLPQLVEYAEDFVFDEEIILPYLKEAMADYDIGSYGTVVLGCTHFPFYKGLLGKIFPRETLIIDGSMGTVKHLRNLLVESCLDIESGNGKVDFYSTGNTAADELRFKKYMNLPE